MDDYKQDMGALGLASDFLVASVADSMEERRRFLKQKAAECELDAERELLEADAERCRRYHDGAEGILALRHNAR